MAHTDIDIADIAALAHDDLLSGLGTEELGAVLRRVERTTVPADTVLARRGAPDDAIGFVLAGQLRADTPGSSPRRLAPGAHWGELVLAGAATHPATVVAATEARVARLDRTALAELARSNPTAALHITQALLGALASGHGASHAIAPGTRASAPLSVETWSGREVFGRSAGLVLLEAARETTMSDLRLGPSITSGRVVSIVSPDAAGAAPVLNRAVQRLIHDDLPFVHEIWDVEAAIGWFETHGDDDAAALLAGWREPTVSLVGCGEARAVAAGPVLDRTGELAGIEVLPHPDGLLLDFGDRVRRTLPVRPFSTIALERKTPRYGAAMTVAEKQWLTALGVTSVGSFNRACIAGRVRDLVHVSEGFHEKHIAQTADEVKARTCG